MCICMKQLKRKEKLSHGGGSGGGLIGSQNAAQFKLRGVRRNPPVPSLI